MADFDKSIDLDKGLNQILDKIDRAAEKLHNEGKEAGESLGTGWNDGIDVAIEKIKASDIKTAKAFSNLSEKLRKQVQQLGTVFNGKNLKFKIDFSNIDINSTEIKDRVNQIVEDISKQGLIEFDTKGSEQQFKNAVTLFVKYQTKLRSLKQEYPNITAPQDAIRNLQQQLILVDQLRDIYSFFNEPIELFDATSISRITKDLETLQKFSQQSVGKSAGSYDELSQVLKEIQGSLRIISDVISNESNALQSMAKDGTTSFETLSQAIIGVYNNLTQVQELVDIISQKDFNITNITNPASTQTSKRQSVKQLKAEVEAEMQHVKLLFDESERLISQLAKNRMTAEAYRVAGMTGGVNEQGIPTPMSYADFEQEMLNAMADAKTKAKIENLLVVIDGYITKLTEVNKLREQFGLGVWQDPFVQSEQPAVQSDAHIQNANAIKQEAEAQNKLNEAQKVDISLQTGAEIQQMNSLKGAIDEVSKAIGRKNAGFIKEKEIVDTSVDTEIAKLRELVNTITTEIGNALDGIKVKFQQSFVVPELDKNNLQTSFDEIYNKFIELKDKIQTMKIDIGINANNIATAIQGALYAKEIAQGYRKADFNDLYIPDLFASFGKVQYQDQMLGDIISKQEAQNRYNNLTDDIFVTKLGTVVGTLQDVIRDIGLKSATNSETENNSWAKVIVEAINTQGGNIVESIKLLLPKNITDTVDESKLISAFDTLTKAIQEYNHTFGGNTKSFFNGIKSGHTSLNDEAMQALSLLGLMTDGKPSFDLASVGGINRGTVLSDKFVLSTQPNNTSGIPDLVKLIEKQNKAYEAGAAVPRIIAGFEDESGNVYQLQTRAQGVNHRKADSGMFGASPEQIDRLLYTFEKLSEVGLYPEFGGDNVMYDPTKGFTIIDLDMKDRHWKGLDNPDNMIAEFLKSASKSRSGDYAKQEKFKNLVWERYAKSPSERLVNAETIAAERAQNGLQTPGANAKIIPTMDEGAVAKLVSDNVAKTPATAKIIPTIDNKKNQALDETQPNNIVASASEASYAIDSESQSAAEAARQFIEAAKAKKEFIEANNQVAKSAEESSKPISDEYSLVESLAKAESSYYDLESASSLSGVEYEFESAESAAKAHETNAEAIQKEVEAKKNLAKVKDVYKDNEFKEHVDVYKYNKDGAAITENIADKVTIDKAGNEVHTIIETIIKDFEAFDKAEKKTEEAVARAQSKLNEFIKKFKSKTGGNAQFVEGFNELSNFTINKDNIEEALNKITLLQARYNELEGDFRKGQTSLNPFTNAINKATNIDNIFGDIEYKFKALTNTSDDLVQKFAQLEQLSKDIKLFVQQINDTPDAITPQAFSSFAKQVGEFNLLKTQIDGEIKKERRAESDEMVSFRRIVKATQARDTYTEKAAKQEAGSDWERHYLDRAAEQQALIEAISAGLKLTQEQEAELSAMAEKHALILKDINLENNKVEEQKQKYEEIMRMLRQNQAEQIGLADGSLKVVDKGAYQKRLDSERAQIDALIKGADLDPKQTKSVADLVKLIADLRVESSNIDLMSKKWMDQNILTDEAKSKIEALRQALLQVTSGAELDLWKKQWKELANEMSMANIDAKEDKKINKLIEDDRVAEVKKYIDLLKLQYDYEKKAAKESEGSKMQSFYNKEIEKVKQKIEQTNINDIANQEEKNRLLLIQQAHEREIAEIKARQASKEPALPFTSEDEKLQKKYDTGYLSNALYNDWQKELAEYRNYVAGVTRADDETIQNKKQHLLQMYDVLTKMSNTSKSFFTSGGELLPKEMWFDEGQINNMSTSLMNLYNQISGERFEGMTTSVVRVQEKLGKLTFTVDDGSGSLSQYTIQANQATGATKLLSDSTKPALTAFQRLGQTLKKNFTGLLHATIGGSGVYAFVRYIRQGIQAVRELDLALTELKKVTDATEETYDRFLDTAADVGARIGRTITDVTSATAEFAKLGYDISMAASMAESALVYANVGDNVDVETGSQSIISTMKAFGIEAENTMSIVDKFNEIGNNFAITTKGIGDALQVSASAMAAAGNSLDETIALTTAANTIVQNPNTVGTALKTLSLRIRGVKTELEEAGLETDGMAETTSQLQAKLKALTDGKVDIMVDANNFKNTTEILREMAAEWEHMTDVEQAAALELLGGKRQANTLSAIISNFDIVEDAIESSANSAGSALKENEKVLDSIQGRINQFNNAMQTMWNNALESDLIKDIVNLGTALLKIVDNIGLIEVTLSTLGIAKFVSWLLRLTTGADTFGVALLQILKPLATFSKTGKTVGETIRALGVSAGTSAGGFTALKVAGQGALVAIKALFTTPLGWLILAAGAVATVVGVVSSANKKLKELRETAIATADAFEEQSQQLKDYATQIQELRKELDSGNLSEAEAYNTREQLISIQKDLIDNFGLEAKGINLVTGAIEAQINAINQLDEANAQTWLNKNYKAINSAIDYFDDGVNGGALGAGVINWGVTKRIQELVNEHAKERDNASYFKALLTPESDLNFYGNPDEIKAEIEHWMDWFKQEENNIQKGISDAYATNNQGLVTSLNKDLAQVQDFLEDLSVEYDKYFGNDSAYVQNKSILEQAQKNTAITEYANQMYAITSSEKAYQEALKTGHAQNINQTLTELYSAIEGASEDAKLNGQQFMVEYFDGLKAGYKDAKFQNDLSINDALKTKVTEALGHFNDLLELNNINQHTVEQKDAYTTLTSVAEEYGYEITDLINLLTNLGYIKAEPIITIKEETNITDSLNKISALEDAYDSLGEAIKEFKEEGAVSANILEGINETFGNIDGFEELYKILATGEGDVETAITKVANAYINQKGILSELSEDEREIMIARLKTLGVINAEEIIQSRQVAQEKLDIAYQQYGIDLSNYTSAEEAKIAIAQAAGLDFSKINDDNLSDLIDHYSIDVSKYATAAQQKIAIAREMAKEVAAANKMAALSELQRVYIGSERQGQSYKDEKSKIEKAYFDAISSIPSDNVVSNIQSIVDEYYNSVAQFDFSDQKLGIGSDYDEIWGEDPTEKASEAFQDEMDYWENLIGANQAKFEQIQNEIDLLEKQGKIAGAEYYQEQIKLEEERLDLLNRQKSTATDMLKSFAPGSDEWFQKKPAYLGKPISETL